MSDHFIRNSLKGPSASLINFIRDDLECKILYII